MRVDLRLVNFYRHTNHSKRLVASLNIDKTMWKLLATRAMECICVTDEKSTRSMRRAKGGTWVVLLFCSIVCLALLGHLLYGPSSRPSRRLDKIVQRTYAPASYHQLNASDDLCDDVTVVTAYFNIGNFAKFAEWDVFTPDKYRKWMLVFARIESPVIGFFDHDEDINHFIKVRRHLPASLTVTHKVDRQTMWSFGMVLDIARIFRKPGYPKHLPNTVVPNYSAAMHAKYEVMQLAIKENPFRTRYFCWLDTGLFRHLTDGGYDPTRLQNVPSNSLEFERIKMDRFSLYLPAGFNSRSVAYQQVWNDRNKDASVEEIVYRNMIWVCGCFFIAEASVMYRWTEEYKAAVRIMIDKYDLMSTDQQVIYAAFNTMSPTTKIQTYKSDGRYNEWFHLGYLAKEAGLARRTPKKRDFIDRRDRLAARSIMPSLANVGLAK